MRFSPSLLDEIRTRLPVSEVVGRRVKLRRQGREFIGLSPFNAEKTPSFTVSDQKGFYHCFSSGKHGDIFRFLMETEGLSFPEAVEQLAGEAGVPLPKPDPRAEARESERAGLHQVMEAAAAFFEERLAGPDGREARAYLERRGVPPALQRRFRLGYAAPARHALKEHLARLGLPADVVAQAGVLVNGPDIPVPFDRFRDRLMFPITDIKERVVAFGGRALSAEAQAKYLNSPETELFHKGRMLFNLAAARRAAHEAGTAIVVEGYMDVIALAGAGFSHAVAPLGTALTEDQLALLWRLTDEPVLCFDGDDAGLRAAFRAVDLALPMLAPGKSLRFALLPEGQDPDDLVRAEGAAGVSSAIGAARPLSEMLWLREFERAPLDTPERRAAFEARLKSTVRQIQDDTVRRHYEGAIAQKLSTAFASRRPAPGSWRRHGAANDRAPRGDYSFKPGRAGHSAGLARSLARRGSPMPRREAILLLALVNHPELLADRAETVAALELASRDLERLKQVMLDGAAETKSAPDMRTAIARAGLADTLSRVEQVWEASGRAEWWVAPDTAASDAGQGWDHTAALQRKRLTLHKELKAAEAALESDPSEENFARLTELQALLANAEGTEALVEGFGQASGRPARAF